MTTIQDRIIKDFKEKFGKYKYLCRYSDDFKKGEWKNLDEVKQFLIQSIKEVEEETRKEIINHIDFFADQSRWFVDEDNGVGPIIQTRVISVEDLQKELLSITNKEKQ